MSTEGAPDKAEKDAPVPLERWLWRSYLRAAIIPLLVIEVTFLAIYWVSNTIVHRENVDAVGAVSRDYLGDVARREAMSVGNDLKAVSQLTQVFARQTLRALDGDFVPPAAEQARYERGVRGGLFTIRDNGTTASFYSNITPIGDEQMRKVWRLAALDPVMIDIKDNTPSVASIYFNTFDSYNRIYPYFDARSQYPADMNIPAYNFYYEADASHNPGRKAVWTDAYVDPAGHGWMVSSIAPVWRREKLEGVVGIDVTLKTVIDRLMSLKLPWDAYAILVDRQGRIIALPPKGEADFRLKELTEHHYEEAIQSDTFKPDSFNIRRRPETRPLAEAMARQAGGAATLQFDGPHIASFARIPGPDWSLVVIAPESEIYRKANRLRDDLFIVGLLMLGSLLVFYLLFFAFLYRRAHAMSVQVAAPLGTIADLIGNIGSGRYRQEFAGSDVRELDQLGRMLVDTGNQLGDANERIVEQEQLVSRALLRQRQVNEEQRRFVRVMSHELRTPLAIIDSGAQIIARKAESLRPDDLQARTGKMRAAVRRISDLLQKMVGSLEVETPPVADAEVSFADLDLLVREIAGEVVPAERLVLNLGSHLPVLVERPPVAIILRSVLDNALRYAPGNTPVVIAMSIDGETARLDVTNQGGPISPSDLNRIGERYFRGSNATATEGVGIGLFVGRTLLEKIGGSFKLASIGNAVTATLTVPVAPVDMAGRTPTGDPTP